MMSTPPVPANEFERLANLSGFDLEYSNLQDSFQDLSRLAAKIAGTNISLVNLIDSFTQWTISSHGMEFKQMSREDSVCQYTIVETEKFEVPDLSADLRFKDLFYVAGEPNLKYYYGLPLVTTTGVHIGALCVLDYETKVLAPEKIELLKIIADEIVNRLKALKAITHLQHQLKDANESKKRLAHDIRGPLAGVIGLTGIITEEGGSDINEILEFTKLISKSCSSIVDLANEILTANSSFGALAPALAADEYNQVVLKEKLEELYIPQALSKKVKFSVSYCAHSEFVPFSKKFLLQIIGNVVSNAIKFTPAGGEVSVDLKVKIDTHHNDLLITIKDSGIGLSEESIKSIMNGKKASTAGTEGENGFGFGLALVMHLIESLKGTMSISSIPGEGSVFEIKLPQVKSD